MHSALTAFETLPHRIVYPTWAPMFLILLFVRDGFISNLLLRGYIIVGASSLRVAQKTIIGGSGQEKAQYGAPRALERAPFQGRVEGSPPHPPLERQSKGMCAYSARSSDVKE